MGLSTLYQTCLLFNQIIKGCYYLYIIVVYFIFQSFHLYEYPKIISNITNNGRNSKLTQQRRRGRPLKSQSKDNIKTVKALKASGSSKLYSPRNQSSRVSDAAKDKYKRIINKYRELKSRKYSETSNDD